MLGNTNPLYVNFLGIITYTGVYGTFPHMHNQQNYQVHQFNIHANNKQYPKTLSSLRTLAIFSSPKQNLKCIHLNKTTTTTTTLSYWPTWPKIQTLASNTATDTGFPRGGGADPQGGTNIRVGVC